MSKLIDVDDGDLRIEGWAVRYDQGEDRDGDVFASGSFKEATADFLSRSSPLCFNHRHEQILGKVLHLEEVPGVGVYFVARVDGCIQRGPLRHIYDQIKRGTFGEVSVGGFFQRQGRKVVRADITELSLTATPKGNGTSFEVVQEAEIEQMEAAIDATNRRITALGIANLRREIATAFA